MVLKSWKSYKSFNTGPKKLPYKNRVLYWFIFPVLIFSSTVYFMFLLELSICMCTCCFLHCLLMHMRQHRNSEIAVKKVLGRLWYWNHEKANSILGQKTCIAPIASINNYFQGWRVIDPRGSLFFIYRFRLYQAHKGDIRLVLYPYSIIVLFKNKFTEKHTANLEYGMNVLVDTLTCLWFLLRETQSCC